MESAIKGVDISEHNGIVDFQSLQAAGYEFVIIRCSAGRREDTMWRRNVEMCEKLGIPYGVYHYSYALSIQYAENEAALTLKLLDGRRPPIGVWFDMEDADGYKKENGLDPWQNGARITDLCLAFCQKIKAAGLKAGVYSSRSWFTSLLEDERLDGFDRWVAEWGSSLKYSGKYSIWQNSSQGYVGGKRFDTNYIYHSPLDFALNKLAWLGVTNSPDYWRKNVNALDYISNLIIKAADKTSKKGSPSSSLTAAIDALSAKGVMNNPEYWLTNAYKVEYLPELIMKLGGSV